MLVVVVATVAMPRMLVEPGVIERLPATALAKLDASRYDTTNSEEERAAVPV